MKTIVRSLLHWFWLLVVCLVVGFIIGKGLAIAIPPTYQSTAVVQLNAQTRSSQAQIIQPVAAYSALITSDSVLNPVLKLHPEVDHHNFITKQLVITPDVPSQSIQIQVTQSSALAAAEIANGLAQLLVAQQNAYIASQYKQEIQIVGRRIADEQKAIDHLNQLYASTPSTNTAALQQLANEIDQQRNLQNSDISTQQALMTEQALYSSPLSVVQSATVPTKPSSLTGTIPFTWVMLAVMFIMGLIAISFLEQNAGRISEAYELQRKVSLPVLGALRWKRPMLWPRQLIDSREPYAEDSRVMMADVLLHSEEVKARIMAITSMKVQAGSSTVASQLAVLLALSKRRVLLVDANLYKPSQHVLFDLLNTDGLARMLEVARTMKISNFSMIELAALRTRQQIPERGGMQTVIAADRQFQMSSLPVGERVINSENGHGAHSDSSRKALELTEMFPFDRCIMPTDIQNLYVMPAGETSLNPSILLNMPLMELFLKWASQHGDYVIIDCPNLTHAESRVLGSISDQTILVVDATQDRMKQVVKIKEELLSSGVKLSGLIVNKLGRWV